MSFSLSISGHHNDADAHQVENAVRAKARDLVAILEDLGVSGITASFSGSTGQGLDYTAAEGEPPTAVNDDGTWTSTLPAPDESDASAPPAGDAEPAAPSEE